MARGIATTYKTGKVAEAALQQAIKRYKSAHWGIDHKRIVEAHDPLLPPVVTALGEKLVEVYLRVPGVGAVQLGFRPGCLLAFDPAHPCQRLYAVLSPAQIEEFRQAMKQTDPEMLSLLGEIARAAGGRQGKYTWPDVLALPVGKITHVIYHTDKLGDGPSNYIHEFGEENRKDIRPILAIEPSGRAWFAGGNYTVPDAGITD